jgi:hypothetical protein
MFVLVFFAVEEGVKVGGSSFWLLVVRLDVVDVVEVENSQQFVRHRSQHSKLLF